MTINANDLPITRFRDARQAIRNARQDISDAIADAVRAEFPSANVEAHDGYATVQYGKDLKFYARFLLLEEDPSFEVQLMTSEFGDVRLGLPSRRADSFRDALYLFCRGFTVSVGDHALRCLKDLGPAASLEITT